jgi:glycosidase
LPGVTDYALNEAVYEALNGNYGWLGGVNKLYSTLAQDFLYKDPTRNCIFLDDHDVSRFYSVVGENFDKYKEGIGVLLTMRGIPEMYYGTEILMKNFSNPDGLVREDFKGGWAEDKVNKFTAIGRTTQENEAFDYVRTLANYRKTSSALQTGKLMQYVPENEVYTYFRYDSVQTVMIIVNSNDTAKTVSTAHFGERMNGFTQAQNVITKEVITDLKSIVVPKRSTTILELRRVK